MKKVVFLFVLFLFSKNLKAQSIPLGSLDFKDERLRNEQLLGKNKSENSFTIRPLLIENDSIKSNKIQLSYLPITLNQQYNTLAPFGRNDGAMIPSKGYQMKLNAGFTVKYNHFNFRFNPEYVYAENLAFELFPTYVVSRVRLGYLNYLNNYDIPERLGVTAYKKNILGTVCTKLFYWKSKLWYI